MLSRGIKKNHFGNYSAPTWSDMTQGCTLFIRFEAAQYSNNMMCYDVFEDGLNESEVVIFPNDSFQYELPYHRHEDTI